MDRQNNFQKAKLFDSKQFLDQGNPPNLQNQTIEKNNFGLWTPQEQEKYVIFLQSHRKIFHSPQQRKEKRIFKVMAEFIGSRDGIQCRSHHMKQLKAHKGKLRNIISKYKKNCDPQIFRPKVVESRENQQILQNEMYAEEIKQVEEGKISRTTKQEKQKQSQTGKIQTENVSENQYLYFYPPYLQNSQYESQNKNIDQRMMIFFFY